MEKVLKDLDKLSASILKPKAVKSKPTDAGKQPPVLKAPPKLESAVAKYLTPQSLLKALETLQTNSSSTSADSKGTSTAPSKTAASKCQFPWKGPSVKPVPPKSDPPPPWRSAREKDAIETMAKVSQSVVSQAKVPEVQPRNPPPPPPSGRKRAVREILPPPPPKAVRKQYPASSSSKQESHTDATDWQESGWQSTSWSDERAVQFAAFQAGYKAGQTDMQQKKKRGGKRHNWESARLAAKAKGDEALRQFLEEHPYPAGTQEDEEFKRNNFW